MNRLDMCRKWACPPYHITDGLDQIISFLTLFFMEYIVTYLNISVYHIIITLMLGMLTDDRYLVTVFLLSGVVVYQRWIAVFFRPVDMRN